MANFTFIDEKLNGLTRIIPQYFEDARGCFIKDFHKDIFEQHNIPTNFCEETEIVSPRNVIRGIHFQKTYPQGKLIRITQGEAYLAAVDLQPDSETFGKWKSVFLSAQNKNELWVPEGFGVGSMTLEEPTTIQIKYTYKYIEEYSAGIKWNDEALNIDWPNVSKYVISEKDDKLPAFREYIRK